MSRLRGFTAKVFIVLLLVSLTSCYGPFNLTQKLHKWNGSLGDKYVNALVFFGLLVVPVYGVSTFADAVIFNTIEFWTGDNPINMAEGESDTKYVQNGDKSYEITAVKNKFIVKDLTSNESAELIFNESEKSWYLSDANGMVKLTTLSGEGENEAVKVQLPDGQELNFNLSSVTDKEVVRQTINSTLLSN